MAKPIPRIKHLVSSVALYSYALLNLFLYLGLSISSGSFFKKETEQDKLQLAIARDAFWNLSKQPIPQFTHHFYTLRNGLKLHYISNAPQARDGDRDGDRNLVVFIHGFPDSVMIWRRLLQTASGKNITDKAIVVCVDLPGYGGSDSLDHYGADEVLEALAEFVIAMRGTFATEDPETGREITRTYLVGHDWGAAIAFRLASEAPGLADRFIVTNGPHVELAFANRDRIVSSASKIFKQFRRSLPYAHIRSLSRSIQTMKPLLIQLFLFGYIAAVQLPKPFVKQLGTGRNFAFPRGIYDVTYGGKGKSSAEFNAGECLACTFGPSVEECTSQTQTPLGEKSETYGLSVLKRAQDPGEAFWHQTAYYRDGVSHNRWNKSLNTIADLHNIEVSQGNGAIKRRRSSSASSAMFGELYKGALHAPATILWGQKDSACTQAICLDGIGDYLARNSVAILLPRSNHWTPLESHSRKALAKIIELYVGEKDDTGDMSLGEVEKAVKEVYSDASVMVRK